MERQSLQPGCQDAETSTDTFEASTKTPPRKLPSESPVDLISAKFAGLTIVARHLSKAADQFSADQQIACIACAIEASRPEIGVVLSRLHALLQLALGSDPLVGSKANECSERGDKDAVMDAEPQKQNGQHQIGEFESLARKALELLVSVGEKRENGDALQSNGDGHDISLAQKIACAVAWPRNARLLAVAILLRCAALEDQHLLEAAFSANLPLEFVVLLLITIFDVKLPGDTSVQPVQVLISSLCLGETAQLRDMCTLKFRVIAFVLRCSTDPHDLLSSVKLSGWPAALMRNVRRLVARESGEICVDDVELLSRQERVAQLTELQDLLGLDGEKFPEETIARALAKRSKHQSPAAMITVFRMLVLPKATSVDCGEPCGDGETANLTLEEIILRIDVGCKVFSSKTARMDAFCCLLQSPANLEGILVETLRLVKEESLSHPCCRAIVESILIDNCSVDEDDIISWECLAESLNSQKDVTDAVKKELEELLKPVPEPPQNNVDESQLGSRFGLGLLELEPLDDSDDDELDADFPEDAEIASFLQSSVHDATNTASQAKFFNSKSVPLVCDNRSYNTGSKHETGWGALKALVEQDGFNPNTRSRSQDLEEYEDEEEEEGVWEAEEEDIDDEDYEEERHPSDDLADYECVSESPDQGQGVHLNIGSDGLLTSMLEGGSLHSEDRVCELKELKVRERARQTRLPKKAKVVFPSLIWRGKDVLVINKPANWVCSASDVDKRKGRPRDPNENCEVKGFKTIEDLERYEFKEREKKYIHWWVQLMHGLDDKSYPTLFDEDQNFGLCHRLDRETSGTVLIGLTELARQQMRECFHRHYVRKLYVCLVHGEIEEKEQTVDRCIEPLGQKARLNAHGKRARTHVKVLGRYTRKTPNGVHTYTLCYCEIAEGRMHQIRVHMAMALGAPIVSEFYYQNPSQVSEDRQWCPRVCLHAYAVGFPDVSGQSRKVGGDLERSDCGLVDVKELDSKQEWHCCICPLTSELRTALDVLTPCDDASSKLLKTIQEGGLLDAGHEAVHVMGTVRRNREIDDIFFPWSSRVNPIDVGDIGRPREPLSAKSKGCGKGLSSGARAKTAPGPPRRIWSSVNWSERNPNSPPTQLHRRPTIEVRENDEPRNGIKRPRLAIRCRSVLREGLPKRLKISSSPPAEPPLRHVRRLRSRSRERATQRRGRSISRGRRVSNLPLSPRRSLSGQARRRRRRGGSPIPPAGPRNGFSDGRSRRKELTTRRPQLKTRSSPQRVMLTAR